MIADFIDSYFSICKWQMPRFFEGDDLIKFYLIQKIWFDQCTGNCEEH
jgi:hypothetical protein